MRLVVVLVPTPGFEDKPALLLWQTSFGLCAVRWSYHPQVVCPLELDAPADVQHAVVVEDMEASETSLSVPHAKKGERVATALKRRFRDRIGQGFSGEVSLIRDAIDLCDTFPLAYKLK